MFRLKKFSKVVSGIGLLALVFGLVFLATNSQRTNALSGAEFNAGRIIDDSVFFTSNSMSVAEIQSFLNNKVDCDFDGSEMTGGITRAQYAAQRGYPTTFTCLPQYKENPTTKANNIGNPNYTPPGAISAAQIIYNASAEHGVSSKALIVLLQKEQGLVTDEWPVPRQYQIATGYGCPDTAPCDQQYYGFYNQINKAAYQFKRYVTNSGSYRYKANQINAIYWSPTTSCGTSNVFIENGATAALYNYTPYRPNQAALNNLYGTGDGCSAYGNRNFWRYFRDWFGSTTSNIPGYAWQWEGQGAWTSSNKQTFVDTYNTTLSPNTRYYAQVRARNTGLNTWSKGDFRLGTTYPTNRSSALCDTGTWINCGRPATLVENTVAPGQVGTFEFWFTTPGPNQTIKEYFNPLLENVVWLNDLGMHFIIKTNSGYAWQWEGQGAWTSSNKQTFVDTYNTTLSPNTRYYAQVRARNIGSTTWNKGNLRLGTTFPTNRYSVLCDTGTWINCGRPATLVENTVAPGQVGTFEFWFTTPGPGQNLKEYFNLLQENVVWLNEWGMHFIIKT